MKAVNGDIYSIDLTAQAAKETAESAKFLSQTNQERSLTSLKGHNRPVTALSVVDEKLISGAENGEVRIWDLASRSSIKVLTPFASETSSENSPNCPISGIIFSEVNDRDDVKLFSSKRKANISQRELCFQPFQRFKKQNIQNDTSSSQLLLPLKVLHDHNMLSFIEPTFVEYPRVKKFKLDQPIEASNNSNEEIVLLKEALAEAEGKVKRWEKVNNKLAAKLKKVTGA